MESRILKKEGTKKSKQYCTFQYRLPVASRRPTMLHGFVIMLASKGCFALLVKWAAQKAKIAASGSSKANNNSDEWPTTRAHAPAMQVVKVKESSSKC